jgi:hypothetical protein
MHGESSKIKNSSGNPGDQVDQVGGPEHGSATAPACPGSLAARPAAWAVTAARLIWNANDMTPSWGLRGAYLAGDSSARFTLAAAT